MDAGMEDEAGNGAGASFVGRMEAAAERESVTACAEEWRGASLERHARVLADVLDMSDAIVRGRGHRAEKPPLPLVKMRGSRLPRLRL